MGAFFGSIHVRTENSDAVQKALEQVANETDCNFWLGPAINGWISIFPDQRGQDDRISVEIAKRLPNDIFHLIVHDDDVSFYFFYRNGRLIDQYNSNPDYFDEDSEEEKEERQGRPELFQDLLRQPKSIGKLKTLLAADKFTFESERMAQFVELIGLPNALSSYEYLQGAEHDEIEGWKQFIHIEKQPDPAKDCNNSGRAKRAKGDLDGALTDFNRAIELKPDFAQAYNNRGLVKKAQGDLNGALADFSKAVELKSDLAAAYYHRGKIKRAKDDLDDALDDYNKAIELKPDLAQAYNDRGLVKKAQGDLNGALADYNKVIELKPEIATAYKNRGNVKEIKGDFKGAQADYDKAKDLKSKGH